MKQHIEDLEQFCKGYDIYSSEYPNVFDYYIDKSLINTEREYLSRYYPIIHHGSKKPVFDRVWDKTNLEDPNENPFYIRNLWKSADKGLWVNFLCFGSVPGSSNNTVVLQISSDKEEWIDIKKSDFELIDGTSTYCKCEQIINSLYIKSAPSIDFWNSFNKFCIYIGNPLNGSDFSTLSVDECYVECGGSLASLFVKDTQNITNISADSDYFNYNGGLFYPNDSTGLSLNGAYLKDASKLIIPKDFKSMKYMFSGCSNLSAAPIIHRQLGNGNDVTIDNTGAFRNCESLREFKGYTKGTENKPVFYNSDNVEYYQTDQISVNSNASCTRSTTVPEDSNPIPICNITNSEFKRTLEASHTLMETCDADKIYYNNTEQIWSRED